MNSQNIVQLVTLIIYIILILLVIRSGRTKEKDLFLIYLFASAGWSLSSFMGNSFAISANQALVWKKMITSFAVWAVIAYYYFISVYIRKRAGLVANLGYVYVLVMIAVSASGLMQGFRVVDGTVVTQYGGWLVLMSGGCAVYVASSYILLIRSYRSSTNPDHRNRIMYLLVGLGILSVLGSIWVLKTPLKTIDHLGHMGNALLISYTVLRYQLLDIKLVLRKGLVYSGITLFITFSCLLLIAMWTYLLRSWTPTASLALTTAIVVVMAILFNPLRTYLEKGANYIFYGKSYDYRETILSFSTKVNNIIDLEQLAEAMLHPLINAVRADQASLLFAKQGYYTSEYAQRYNKDDPVTPITLRKNSPVIKWMEREGVLLTSDIIWREPEFKGMWEEDRNALAMADIEVLCPIRNKQKLVAVLALSKKHRLGFYSRDDTDLVMTLALGAAVAIENAELYEKAKERANTDELTNLFNHRFFHQRLDEELSRSSRFGTVFSLLFLDIDMFKTYNDVYGHLAGDEILRNIGRYMKTQVRDTDICFRYGGDEFAVILPETPADGVQAVAERIRKGVESSTDWPGDPITVSIGIACWPTDGVIKEDLIHSSDAALYYAKQTGKNRTCLACEVVLSDVLRMETNTNPQTSDVILSTIYALAATVDAKDHYTYGHSKKVSQYSSMIAEGLGYEGDDLERIRTAALLHDIGKIGISDRLLQKKECLTPDEWELIRAHPDLGVSIIKHIESLHSCLAAIQYHHERYDGSGYPSGLKGNNIPMDARILSVADAFDAMTSARPYRDKGTYADAVVELESCAGTQFDPEVVKIFKNLRLKERPDILSKSWEIPVRK